MFACVSCSAIRGLAVAPLCWVGYAREHIKSQWERYLSMVLLCVPSSFDYDSLSFSLLLLWSALNLECSFYHASVDLTTYLLSAGFASEGHRTLILILETVICISE